MENTNNQYKNTVLIAILVLLAGASISLHQFKIPTIMPQLMEMFKMSANTASWTMSIFTLVGVFIAIPTGGLVDKLSGKKVMLYAFLFVAVGSIIGGMTNDTSILLATRALEGIGFVLISVAGPIAIRENCNPDQIGRAMGFWGAYVAVGQIVAFNLTGILYDQIGVQNIWFVYAAITVILGLIAQFTLKSPNKSQVVTEAVENEEKLGFSSVVKNKSLLSVCIGFAFFNLLVMATVAFLPSYIITNGLMSPGEASFVATIPMIGCIIFSPIFGRLSESWGLKKIYLLAILGAGLGTILVYQTSTTMIWVGVILWGIIGLNGPAMMFASIGQMVSPKEIGMAQGLCMMLQNCGMFLGTAIFIPILESVGGNYLTNALIIAVPATIIAFITVNMAKFR